MPRKLSYLSLPFIPHVLRFHCSSIYCEMDQGLDKDVSYHKIFCQTLPLDQIEASGSPLKAHKAQHS